jgi:hypothetical protein
MSDAHGVGLEPAHSFVDLSRVQWTCWGVVALAGALWLADHRAGGSALALAVFATALAAGPSGRSLADRLATASAFVARGRWTFVSFVDDGREVVVVGRGKRHGAVSELDHRGRLDLSGRLEELARELAALMERLAAAGVGGRISWHLVDDRVTILSTPLQFAPGGSWRPWAATRTAAAFGCCRGSDRGWLFERWRYLRTPTDVRCVFEVESLTAQGAAELFRRLAPLNSGRDVAVIVEVLAAAQGERMAGRQAHRWRADQSALTLAGFRHRAAQARRGDQLSRREGAVAEGRALGSLRAFIVVRAPTLSTLDDAVRSLRDDARRFGARVRRGDGRHATWFAATMPGAPPR